MSEVPQARNMTIGVTGTHLLSLKHALNGHKSAHEPQRKEEAHNLSKVSWFLFKFFYIRRLQNQFFFSHTNPHCFERYTTVLMVMFRAWATCGHVEVFKMWSHLINNQIIEDAFKTRSPKVSLLLIYSHSFVQIYSNQKPAGNCPQLLIG